MSSESRFQVQLKIRKPAAEVFDAVVNPKKLAGYFVGTASGPLEPGKKVQWTFPEPQLKDLKVEVEVKEVVPPERIVLVWNGGRDYDTRVEMRFQPLDANNTMVQISESGWRDDPQSRELSYGNCGGWMNMITSMKASLEYGINLREGGLI